MVLVNVRLDADDARRVKALREAGIPLSPLVREAIRSEYERRIAAPQGAVAPSAIIAAVIAALPDHEHDGNAPRVDATDRRAVRRHVRAKLRR